MLDTRPLPAHLSGEGVFTIPYGPVRSGVFESIEYLVETPGEDIPHLRTRVFHKHRGIECRFEGLGPRRRGAVGRAHRRRRLGRPCPCVLPGGRADRGSRGARRRGRGPGDPRRARARGQPPRLDHPPHRGGRPSRGLRPPVAPQGTDPAPTRPAVRQPVRPGRGRPRRRRRPAPSRRAPRSSRRSTGSRDDIRSDLRLLLATPSFVDRLRGTGVIPRQLATAVRPPRARSPEGRARWKTCALPVRTRPTAGSGTSSSTRRRTATPWPANESATRRSPAPST